MKRTLPPPFPVFLRLNGRLCVVVGAGKVGLRRAAKLLASGALVRLVAPETPGGPLLRHPSLRYLRRPFQKKDLKGAFLAFACTDQPKVNAEVLREARRRGLWANRADAPSGDFLVPATARRGAVTAAFSTAGRDPALSRRHRIEWAAKGKRGGKP